MNDGSRYAQNSVLSSGKWIQIQVKENAVYKLTYEEIAQMGINDPAKVKIYGYGGWILDEDFSKPYIDDLPEVAVWMDKGSDGIFNAGDFLLFYGRGPVKWTYNSSKELFEHENNPYSTYGSYFLTESSSGPKIMEEINPVSTEATNLTTFDDYVVHEKDERAILNSGRLLFGESFIGASSLYFSFTFPGITSDPGKVRLSFVGVPPEGTSIPIYLSIDNEELLKLTVNHPPLEYQRASLVNGTAVWNGEKKEKIMLNVSYNSTGQSTAYLDYITINMKRQLRFYETAFTFFRNKESLTSNVKYSIENASAQSLIWDISGNYDVKIVKTSPDGNKLSFSTQKDNLLHEYVMVNPAKSFPTPVLMSEIKNQDLHAIAPVDLVIIAPEIYFQQAELLAEKHRESGLKVIIAQPEWIYNEFSSGNPDATAYRRFMKMFYDRAETENDKPKYLLLFGDGLFDNRHLTETVSRIDFRFYLLSYQMVESINETYSYGTDDYFGFLDDNEGTNLSQHTLDIGIGRFPVSSISQAENAVHKLLSYMNNTYYSEWKNKIIFTADDSDLNSEATHAKQANDIATYIETNYPQYMIVKSYMDAFAPVTINGKKSYPDAKKKFLNNLKEGCFLLNYTGHGSKTAWSGEDMLYITDVRQMNFEGLPLWITATCDFGWFDGTTTSAGEEAFLNKKSGAIALFTTSRVVYSSDNFRINDKLVRNIFSKVDGKRPRLGDIARISKNELGTNSNKLNYVLLGDPALQLNYPELDIELEKINGEIIDKSKTYSFRALDKVVLEGKITENTENKNIVAGFNGKIKVNIYDSKRITNTRGYIRVSKDTIPFTYSDYPNCVFVGNANVENGKFSIPFTVPLDISYTKEKGKMILYAYDENNRMDAKGYYMDYMLAGSNDNMDYPETGPEIRKMFLNTESFKDGDNVNETPFFVAYVSDEIGINMSGNGLGHDITICIDNSPKITYPLNAYYSLSDGQEGEIKFSIPELAPGKHTLVFKVWNILNVSSTDSLHFNVVKGLKPNLYDITATNTPARDNMNFRLRHDRPESVIDVEIFVYDLMGRPVWSHKETGSSSWLKQYEIEWDLTNSSGNRIEQGIYLYQAVVKAPEGQETTKAKKMIVLKQ
jgi:hypothetical protein